MAVFSVLNSLNPIVQCPRHSHFTVRTPLRNDYADFKSSSARRRRTSSCRLVVLSNPKILRSYHKTRYGRTPFPYDSFDEDDFDEEEEDFDEDEEEDEDESDDDWFSDDESAEMDEFDTDRKRDKSKGTRTGQGNWREPGKGQGLKSSKSERSLNFSNDHLDAKNEKKTLVTNIESFSNTSERPKMRARELMIKTFPRLYEEIDMDAKWIPLLDYLSTFGLKESHFIQIYERRMSSLQINVVSAQKRLDYLMSIGVKHRDVKRILLRQPQILEYSVENNLKPHVTFLAGLGIPGSRIGQIIASSPSLFSYSVENSLKPTVRYLVEEVGIKENSLGKVVQLSPQILVQRIDLSWNSRYIFLSKELGASRDSVLKMVIKHPQFLHYSIVDGILPRINFLRSIGMRNSDILKVLTSLTQVLSLSLEDNLKPKFMYLVNELNNEVHSLTKYPTYLSLSLDQRIRPRHRFLVSLKKAPKGPFPLSSFVPTDESFCQQWAGTSVDKYLEFRQMLLLQKFTKKYERR